MNCRQGLKTAAAFGLAWWLCAAARGAEPAAGLAPAMTARMLENLGVVVAPKGSDGVRIKSLVTLEGQPAKAGTAVTVRWDDRGLTVIFDCEDGDVRSEKRERDAADIWKDDTVEVFLDIGRKRNTMDDNWFHVILSAGAVEYDECGPAYYSKSSGDPQHADRAWTLAGLKTKSEKTKTGWRAEIFMPWEDLGGQPANGELWGFNVARGNWPEEEFQCLMPTLGPFYNSDRWAMLLFIDNPLADQTGILAEAFHDLRVKAVPQGSAGTVIERFRTLVDTPSASATRAETRWDDQGLMIVFDCEDKEIKAGERQRDDVDNIWKDDTVEVFLDLNAQRDPRSDRWVHVALNAAGAVADERGPMEWYPKEYNAYTGRMPATPKGGDVKWDLPGLKARTEKTKTGWRAEIFMPWEGLGGKPAAGDAWGFNLSRNNWPEEDFQCFAPTVSFLHNIERWGYLVFLEAPLELKSPGTAVRPDPRPGPAPRIGENLVFNGDFSKHLEGWTVFPAVTGKNVHLPQYAANDEHQSEGKILFPATREHVIKFGSPYGRAESRPFPLDPAFRYQLALDMRNVHWNARVFVDGYRWKPGVKKHAGVPLPEELQKVWRSRPLIYRVQPARNLREQNFCYPPGKWATATLEFPDPDATVSERRAWNEAEFGRVYLDAPLGGGNFSYGYVYVDDVKVEQVE